jgi:hypothetical protein
VSEHEHGGEVPAPGNGADAALANDAAPTTEPPPTDPVPTTGVAAADAAAQRLAELADAPVEAHVGIYEDVHRRLQEGLADLDEQ